MAGQKGAFVYGRTGQTTKNSRTDGRRILKKYAIIIKMIKNAYTSESVHSSAYPSEKHKAWKGERTGLFIRVPVEIAKDLRAEAQQTQQHFNDVAVNRLRTNVK